MKANLTFFDWKKKNIQVIQNNIALKSYMASLEKKWQMTSSRDFNEPVEHWAFSLRTQDFLHCF